MKHYPLFVIIGFLLMLSGCRKPNDLVFRSVKNVSLQKLSFSTAALLVDLVYYNPNNFGVELRQTDLDVFVNGNYLGKSTQDVQVKVPKRAEFTLPLKLDVDMKNLIKHSIIALSNQEVTLNLKGRVKIGKAGVFKSFPVDYTTVQQFRLWD